MLRNYILITFRSIARNKIFILINVFGLGIAVACCVVGYLIWDFSAGFDKNHVHAKSIYRIQSYQDYQGQRNRFATAPTPLGGLVRQNFSNVDKVVRYTAAQSNFRIGDEVFSSSMAYADSAFFDLFTFTLKSGTFSSLYDKSQILISDELARKYFDSEEVAGRLITQINNGILKEYIIGGVFEEQPLNSSFGFKAITLWDNYRDAMTGIASQDTDWKAMSNLFIQVKDQNAIPGITQQLQAYVQPQNAAREDLKISEYYLQNFSTLAANFYGDTWLSGEQLRWGLIPSAVIGPAIMAIFLLLLACFNFTNTSIAISGRRLKEIGVRKTMGSLRGQLIFQFLSESLVLCFMSLIVGLIIAEFLVPLYNSMWPGIKLTLSYSDNILFFFFLAALLICMALIAGTYPAFYVTSFKPVSILKGKLTFGGTNWFTRTLLTLQLVISLLCIISSVAYVRNASYQRDFDLGYSKNGIIVASVNGENEFNAFRNALATNKDVIAVAGSKDHVSDKYYRQPVKYGSTEHQVEIVDIGDDYLKTMNITLLDGRDFIKDSQNDINESVIVSKTFVKDFGLESNAVGKRVLLADSLQLYIVGVVPDILTDGFWKPAAPVMLRYVAPNEYTQIVVSASPANLLSVNDFMVSTWKKISPNTLYNGKHVDSNLYVAQLINANAVRICVFLGVIAALMSATALFALVSLNILKKRKELGVRKVLGASIANIVRVINMEFMLILIAACVLGAIAGYFLTDKGMDAIWEHYLPIDILTMAICVGLLIVIAMITVGYKTISTALTNPVESLREE